MHMRRTNINAGEQQGDCHKEKVLAQVSAHRRDNRELHFILSRQFHCPLDQGAQWPLFLANFCSAQGILKVTSEAS
jgi:hypothetical protein